MSRGWCTNTTTTFGWKWTCTYTEFFLIGALRKARSLMCFDWPCSEGFAENSGGTFNCFWRPARKGKCTNGCKERSNATLFWMVGHYGEMWMIFEDLGRKHRQSSLRPYFDKDTCTCLVHRVDLRRPLNGRGHLWGKLGKNAFFCIRSVIRIECSIHVRRDRNLRPVDFKRGQEPAQWFVCRSNNARMESVACCQGDAIESFSFKDFHDVLNGLCSTCNNGHLRRVLVGGYDVAFCGIKDTFNSFVWGGDTGHQALVINFDGTHLSSTCSRSP